MHRFYINSDNINGDNATLSGQDAKHLANVLRLTSGDTVELLNGTGLKMVSEISQISSGKVLLKIIHKSMSVSEPPVHIAIAQGFLKDKKMDILIRHLTELGMGSWHPFFSERSIPNPSSEKIRKRVKRWEKITRESIKQCGRTVLPKVCPPLSLNALLNTQNDYDEKIAFWENDSCPFDTLRCEYGNGEKESFSKGKNTEHSKIEKDTGEEKVFLHEKPHQKRVRPFPHRVLVLIGPEGGLSNGEIQEMKKNGFRSFSLGPRILRAETAAIAACALVQNFFGDLGKNFLTQT